MVRRRYIIIPFSLLVVFVIRRALRGFKMNVAPGVAQPPVLHAETVALAGLLTVAVRPGQVFFGRHAPDAVLHVDEPA